MNSNEIKKRSLGSFAKDFLSKYLLPHIKKSTFDNGIAISTDLVKSLKEFTINRISIILDKDLAGTFEYPDPARYITAILIYKLDEMKRKGGIVNDIEISKTTYSHYIFENIENEILIWVSSGDDTIPSVDYSLKIVYVDEHEEIKSYPNQYVFVRNDTDFIYFFHKDI